MAIERDPEFIAAQLKLLREMFRLTQENLADLAGVTTRTIEKAESGRHAPSQQTLELIAKAFGMGIDLFRKPSPEEQAQQQDELERAMRTMILVPMSPPTDAGDLTSRLDGISIHRIDLSAVESDAALQLAVMIGDGIRDWVEIWEDISLSERLEAAQSLMNQFQEMEALGYVVHFGRHKVRHTAYQAPTLAATELVMSFRPKSAAKMETHALVTLKDPWETA